METWSWSMAREEPSLEAPLRKIERADEHIANLSAKIDAFLSSCGYKVRRDFQGDPPWLKITVEEVNFPPVPYEFSILAGEAVYHLRSALDYLVFELIRANKNEPFRSRKIAWPIFSRTPKDKSVLEGKVEGVSPAALELIESFQPYRLGASYEEHPLWRLKEFNDWDKHNFFIRAFLTQPGGIVVNWIDEAGEAKFISDQTTEGIDAGYEFSVGPGMGIRPEMDIEIKSEPKVIIENITGSHNEAVIPVLLELSGEVRSILQKFRGEFS